MSAQPAVFLDRDGVINFDPGYVYRIDDYQFIPGVFSACREFIRLGYQIIIITNQSGIARGLYTEDDFKLLTKWMLDQFKEHGVEITDIYFCPHHEVHGKGQYKIDCLCRKPKPGMIKQAESEHQINLKQSILIGDKPDDIKAGRAAGIAKNFLVKSGKPIAENSVIADGIYDDLLALVNASVL
ncbi:MAG: D-glycero-beta-D-manno-heptose 1,7-bisphosphate 7-phosphatase [Thiotrichaceae bacterium]|nr:D-glycero-beta-D-manno-heptose 1,7-bisphosphate 7-phosphatase [Thiotrichaceae bacterium]